MTYTTSLRGERRAAPDGACFGNAPWRRQSQGLGLPGGRPHGVESTQSAAAPTVQDCTAVDTPYSGCTAQDCTAVDTPYSGCTVQDCTAVDTPYSGCTAQDCTDGGEANAISYNSVAGQRNGRQEVAGAHAHGPT